MWKLELSPAAEQDIEDILFYSELSHGETARLRYAALIETALHDVAINPDRVGVRKRDELGLGARTYHLFHSRQRARTSHGIVRTPRHMLLFRLMGETIVGIGRVLHDAMELSAHLPPDDLPAPPHEEEG